MTPERWEQVADVYHAALELAPSEWASFLHRACGSDDELRREVESLLAAHKQAGSLIAVPALEVVAQALAREQKGIEFVSIPPVTTLLRDEPDHAVPGRMIGRFRILSLLGRGGMGEVYLAEDSRLGRKVALKLLPARFTQDEERVRRFEQEARAASALNHPNIITIFEIGETEDAHYIATEYVTGQTLRQMMADQKMSFDNALSVAMQTASALAEAHQAGILHRDIKPENLMMRPDGLVKVLDFGLAKLTDRSLEFADNEGINTASGIVMGTARYMSPEQARGHEVAAQTDIFSLGVVLYEMVTGRRPFEGLSASHVLVAIQEQEPDPLANHDPQLPAELQRIVACALAKPVAERYQTAAELLDDLKLLQEELSFAAKLKRATSDKAMRAVSVGTADTTYQPTVATAETATRQTASHYARLAFWRARGLTVALMLAAIVIAAAAFFWFKRTPVLTERDTVLLADFDNTTGEGVFDGALKLALAVQLEQSPFLNIYSDERVRETLRLMGRSPNERVTRDAAREICQRRGLKAMLVGSIASLGRHYVLTLEAVNAQTGDVLVREQAAAENREQLLSTLGAVTRQLREKLGESLRSIKKFDAPIEQATTSSLDALRAYSLALSMGKDGKHLETIPLLERAVEIDPNFALAYSRLAAAYENTWQPERAIASAQKAFSLRHRVSEREKFHLTFRYHSVVTRDLEKAIEVGQLWQQTYPYDDDPPTFLSARYYRLGKFDQAIAASQEALRRNPANTMVYVNQGAAYLKLNRFAEAQRMFERFLATDPDALVSHNGLYLVAFIQGNAAAMQQHLDWAKGKPAEPETREWQAAAAMFKGQLRRAIEIVNPSLGVRQRHGLHQTGPGLAALDIKRTAIFGYCPVIKMGAVTSLSRNADSRSQIKEAQALALCGELDRAQSIMDEAARRNPHDTILNLVWVPVVRGIIELRRGNYALAIEHLQSVGPYEGAAQFWPAYLRGQAYLLKQSAREASAEFQKILDRRGEDPVSPLYPLAHLGMARAAVLSGDIAKARQSYQDFFMMWKDADPDLPILIEAKKEYEKLR